MKMSICIVLLVISLIVIYTPVLRAADKGERTGRFQIEIFGGYSNLGAGDLNRLPETDFQTQAFMYDALYDFLRANGYINSWAAEVEGEYRKIANGFPFGFRLKYFLGPSVGLSVGFRSIARTMDSNPSFRYTRTNNNATVQVDQKEYSLYTLSARGYAPMLGIHLEKRLKKGIAIEGYIAGGPLFARCRYAAEWSTALVDVTNTPILLYEDDGSLEEEGTSTGIAAEGGVRVNVPMGNRFGVFLGVGYAYRSAGNISGKGREVRGNRVQEWDDGWGIKEERLVTYWGEQALTFPTNYWNQGTRAGNFRLDLSGFQLQAGVFYRF